MAVSIKADAYIRAVLHACKHPKTSVVGALLGTGKGNDVRVEACLPLFHHTPLAPLLEVAMTQASAYAEEKKWEVVGCYTAAQLLSSSSSSSADAVSEHVNSLVSRIAERFPRAIALVFDNESLLSKDYVPYKIFSKSDNRFWAVNPEEAKINETLEEHKKTLDKVRQLVIGKEESTVYDFEEHMDNVSLNWLHSGPAQITAS